MILFRLLALPVMAPAAGIRYCLEKVAEVAERQLWDEDPVREELILLNESFDNGDLSEPDFREREAALLRRLREIREHHRAAAPDADVASEPEGRREVVIELPKELR